MGRVGVLPPEVVIDPAFSLNDCDIPRLPNRDAKASFTDGLVFIRMRVVSLNKCECLAVSSERKRNGGVFNFLFFLLFSPNHINATFDSHWF